MENYKCKSVGIIGSGIQGICIGLQLIKKGIPVTLFDKQDPLSFEYKPASYGNAGHFSPYAVLQFNRPDILYDVPKMLFSSYGPLALKWNYIPKMFKWFMYYLKNCNTNKIQSKLEKEIKLAILKKATLMEKEGFEKYYQQGGKNKAKVLDNKK